MDRRNDKHEIEIEAAARTLVLLNKQADEARAELAGLQHNLADLQGQFDAARSTNLQEANEKLVLAALHAETLADTAVSKLDELAQSSQRDALTGLANRTLLLDRLANAITVARRHEARIAVLFVDLDGFKPVNDAYGHAIGDQALRETARRLESVVRGSDTVSRFGGDEFIVLLGEVKQPYDAAIVAAKLLRAIGEPICAGDRTLRLSASIGIAGYPQDGEDPVTLIERADAAMYHCKRNHGGCFMYYSEAIRGEPAAPPFTVTLQPAPRREPAAGGPDAHFRDLREANEHLVLALLSAQELEEREQLAHAEQISFLAMVAHELRGTLTPIRTAAEMSCRAHSEQGVLEQLQALIKGQITRMTRLLDDLLLGSRAASSVFRLERSNIDIKNVVKLSVATCQPAMDVKLQKLKVQLPPGPLTVYGDPVRLAQVLSNLLSNACKYTPERGQITLTGEVRGDKLILTVADTGIGITADALPHIFKLFVRDVRAMGLDHHGPGIGLAVVVDLVEAHGGSIVATSDGANLGSQFVVTLPMNGQPGVAAKV